MRSESRERVSRRSIHLQLRRDQEVEDSFHQLRTRSAEDMRGLLQVHTFTLNNKMMMR